MIGVLVVDDEPMVCAHLRTILDATEDIRVVGEAYDGAEAVEAVTRHRPHLVLMDLRMPGVDGLTAIGRIRAFRHPPVVVVLTTFDADGHVIRAMNAGAAGFLLKSTRPADLAALIRVAAAGHTVLSPAATRGLLGSAGDERSGRERRRARLAELTAREIEVLGCLGRGLSNAGVADRLHLSETTVKGHVSRILVKLGLGNRTQAGLLAFELGLHRDDPHPTG